MQLTIETVLSEEMSRCLSEYKSLAEYDDKETLNNRYLCLQTAMWMQHGGAAPAIRKPVDEIRTVIRDWVRDIQRRSTIATMHHDGRVVGLLNDFLEQTKPITAGPAQLKLV